MPAQGSEAMHKVEIRPGVSMAYEDDWFGPPWTAPETVVMVHGNSKSSRAWTQWVPHLAGTYRVIRLDLPGFGASTEPPGYGWSARRARGRHRAVPGRAGDRDVPPDRRQVWRIGLHAARQRRSRSGCASLCLFGSPVRGSGSGNADAIRAKGVRQWAAETMRSRLGSTASQAQMTWWADELMGKTNPRAAFGASAARIDMELEEKLSRITAPTLIVTTQESGLQSVEAVERYARRIPDARVIVLPGDSYHIAAVEPELCAQHALRFLQQVAAKAAGRPPLRGPPNRKNVSIREDEDMTVLATRRAFVGGVASCGALAALSPTAGLAQARPVRIVVPFAPGGGADLIARLLSPHLQQLTGQSFYVENRAGAAGRIGTGAVAKSEPDGQTLLMTTKSSIVIAPHIGVSMNYDPLKELAPISLLTRNAVILVVHPSVPANTLKDYMALARAKPGELFYASSGVGGPNHLAGEIFKQMTGLEHRARALSRAPAPRFRR